MTASVAFAALAVWTLHGLAMGSTQSETAGRSTGLWPTNWRANWLTNLTRRDHQLERWLNAPAARTRVATGAAMPSRQSARLLGTDGTDRLRVRDFAVRGHAEIPARDQRIPFGRAPRLRHAGDGFRDIARGRHVDQPLVCSRTLIAPRSDATRLGPHPSGEMATAMAIDLTPPALVFAAAEALAWNLQAGPRINWSAVPVSFLTLLLFGFSLLLSCANRCGRCASRVDGHRHRRRTIDSRATPLFLAGPHRRCPELAIGSCVLLGSDRDLPWRDRSGPTPLANDAVGRFRLIAFRSVVASRRNAAFRRSGRAI